MSIGQAEPKLPPNLFLRRNRYYSWRDPRTKREYGLGTNREEAIRQATEVNRRISAKDDAERPRIRAGRRRDERGLLNVTSIKSGAMPAAVSGIYLLLLDGDVVYVGQSKDCVQRVPAHKKDKRFDSYTIVPAKEEHLNELEAAYIAKYKPRYNVIKPQDHGRSVITLHGYGHDNATNAT